MKIFDEHWEINMVLDILCQKLVWICFLLLLFLFWHFVMSWYIFVFIFSIFKMQNVCVYVLLLISYLLCIKLNLILLGTQWWAKKSLTSYQPGAYSFTENIDINKICTDWSKILVNINVLDEWSIVQWKHSLRDLALSERWNMSSMFSYCLKRDLN